MSLNNKGEKYPNPNTVPMIILERAFWRRKLPPAFRFYLQGLSRELMLNEIEDDYNQHAADFFQHLLNHRNVELDSLPLDPYLDKLMRKLGIPKICSVQDQEPPPPPPVRKPIRCARCGRWLNPEAEDQSGGKGGASNVITHMEGDEECKVIALPPSNQDAFGRFISHVVDSMEKDEEETFSTRSLSFIVDY